MCVCMRARYLSVHSCSLLNRSNEVGRVSRRASGAAWRLFRVSLYSTNSRLQEIRLRQRVNRPSIKADREPRSSGETYLGNLAETLHFERSRYGISDLSRDDIQRKPSESAKEQRPNLSYRPAERDFRHTLTYVDVYLFLHSSLRHLTQLSAFIVRRSCFVHVHGGLS